ncbi:acetyl-CoA C-acyltransferase [Paracoccaceae bacterium Fryx2]|nr:acetyl-CoA C-acyltransferase [Paracoccaceae bacterium Fryx2]
MTAFVIAARRTPVMPHGGAYAALSLADLAAPVLRTCLADAGIEAGQVDELVLSNALGAGGNPARLVALAAGLPEAVAGLSIDRQCAGGLDALLLARALVVSGQAEVVLAGGVESWSRRPLRQRTDPAGGPAVPYDAPPFTPWPERDPSMLAAAAALADALGIGREAQDGWAVASHARALAARDRMRAEIVPLLGQDADGFTRVLTPALAARARPLAGSITPANAAVAADGAAFCLVVSARIAAQAPRALRIAGGASLGGRPEAPGLAPVAAIARVLGRAEVLPHSLTCAEVMEAYAVQAIACVQGAGLDPARANAGGGALARGHPIGASGAVLAVRLFHDLGAGHGLAAIAAAGGIGTALLLEA